MNNTSNIKGKLPPQALDLEEAVLSAALVDSRGVDTLMELITIPEVFYKPAHQHIFKAMKSLYDGNQPVDILTVSERLNKLGVLSQVGGEYALVLLSNMLSSSANTSYHCALIIQKYIQRKLIAVANEVIEGAYNPSKDVFELLDEATSGFDFVNDIINNGYTSMDWATAVASIPQKVQWLTNNQGVLTGVTSGLKAIDKQTNGWQPGDFIVLGADNGMGKTALVMGMKLAAAKLGKPTGMFSMEMPVMQLATRAVAVSSNYHMKQLTHHGFEKLEYFEGLNRVVNEVKDLPIHIDDKPALTVAEMKRKARAMKRKHKIELLVIDFIQMFSGDNDIRINVSEAARECKNIAKELNIPVIALSQLSREVKREQYKIPQKHHLKESSAIEEAADIIGLIYRPGYYGYDEASTPDLWERLELKDNENSCLMIVKNRHGAMGNIGMHYIENKTKYVNPEEAGNYWNSEAVDLPRVQSINEDHFM